MSDLSTVTTRELRDELCRRGSAVFLVILDAPDALSAGGDFRLSVTGSGGTLTRLLLAVVKAVEDVRARADSGRLNEIDP